MKAAGLVDFGTNLENPDFAKLAEAAGILGLKAETPDKVRPMIAAALEYDGPALLEVPVSRHELSMPPTITLEQAKGFGLFALKAVLRRARRRADRSRRYKSLALNRVMEHQLPNPCKRIPARIQCEPRSLYYQRGEFARIRQSCAFFCSLEAVLLPRACRFRPITRGMVSANKESRRMRRILESPVSASIRSRAIPWPS